MAWLVLSSAEPVPRLSVLYFLDQEALLRVLSSYPMGSSDRLFNRQRTVHQILGGGLAADVILWRRKNVTRGILLVTLAAWVVFERSSYTLLSLFSSVLLLLTTILFLWAKSAALLNRPAPPLPKLHLSEDAANYLAALTQTHINALLSAFQNIALGKDSMMFVRVAGWLLLMSLIGGLTDLITLGYATLFLVLTVPALYEKYEENVDKCAVVAYSIPRKLYVKLDEQCFSKVHRLILEKRKLS